jgi:hypothetical protein
MEETSMKTKLAIIAGMLLLFSFLAAQDPAKTPAKPVLEKGDVMKFIKTFPLLKKDFDKFGAVYSAKKGNVTIPDALRANSQYHGILKKHGWDEHFFNKFFTIVRGYSSIVYGKEMKKADPEIAKALKQIEENAHLSDAMKEQMKKQIMATKGVSKMQSQMMKQWVHPKDLALIKPLVKELKKVMDESK